MNRRRTRRFLVFFFLIPLLAAAETISFSGDRMESVLAAGRERTLLSGNAYVATEENVIRADVIELYGDEFQYIRTRGNVQVLNEKKQLELSCQELFYDREAKVIRVNGNVVMIDKKNEMVVKGGFLEDWEEREETIVQIGVRVLKEDLVCRCEFARYLRSEDKLELAGMPLVNWKGDEYRALKIFMDLEADTIRLEGAIQGTVVPESEEEE
jgi:lipopolysaccharide export system protein LptA